MFCLVSLTRASYLGATRLSCRSHLLTQVSSITKENLANRKIHCSSIRNDQTPSDTEKSLIRVNYITKNGDKIVIYGKEGDNVMYLAQKNSVDIEGACEASLACCTCHVYVHNDYFDKLSSPTEEEEDLLDMAPFLKPNSRLSCQIILSKDIDDIEVTLPPATRNFYVDDHKPSHH